LIDPKNKNGAAITLGTDSLISSPIATSISRIKAASVGVELGNDVVSDKDEPMLVIAGRLGSGGTEVGGSLDRRVLIRAHGRQKRGLYSTQQSKRR